MLPFGLVTMSGGGSASGSGRCSGLPWCVDPSAASRSVGVRAWPVRGRTVEVVAVLSNTIPESQGFERWVLLRWRSDVAGVPDLYWRARVVGTVIPARLAVLRRSPQIIGQQASNGAAGWY